MYTTDSSVDHFTADEDNNVHPLNGNSITVVVLVVLVAARDVHGNGKDWNPMGPMGFPWEWK